MIRIAIAASEHAPAHVRTSAAAVVVIGRDPRCELALSTPGISATHCRLSPMSGVAGAYVLEDLGSSYGTYVNGTKVGRPVVVSSRDTIVLGTQALCIVEGDDEAAALARLQPAPAASTPPSATVAPAPAQRWQDLHAHYDALALRWHEAGRGRVGLLRGRALAQADAWLIAGRDQSPAPQPLHRDFVEACHRAGRRRGAVFGGVAAVAVAGATAGLWWHHREDVPVDAPVQVDAPVVDPSAGPEPDPPRRDEDRAALLAAASAIDEPESRLAVLAELARLPGPLLGDGRFGVLAAVVHELDGRQFAALPTGDATVTALAWGRSGRWLVSGDDGDAIALWHLDAPAPTLPTRLLGHVDTITALAVAADGRWLLSASGDRTLRRWDLRAADPGATAAVLRGHEAAPRVLAIAPDGRFAVSGDELGALRAWDLEASPPASIAVRTDAHAGPLTDLRFEGDGTLLSAGDDRLLRRWQLDAAGGLRPSTRFEGANSGLTRIAIDRVGHRLLAGAADGSIALWDPAQGPSKPLILLGHDARVNDLVVTADGRTLVSASDDDTLRVWDLGAVDPSLASIVFAGHEGDVTAVQLAASDTRVVSASRDATVRVWDLTKKERVVDRFELARHGGAIAALAVSGDGWRGASAGPRGQLWLWDPLTRGGAVLGKVLRVGAGVLTDGALAQDGRALLVGGAGGQLQLWPLDDGVRVPGGRALLGVSSTVTAVALDRTGLRAAAANDRGNVTLWSLADPAAPPRALGAHDSSVTRLGFVGDGTRLLSAGSDGTVRLWASDGDAQAQVLRVHVDEIGAMAIAPDGHFAATGSLDGRLVRWDLRADAIAQGAVLLAGHEGEIRTLAISADGRWLASGGADRRARLWSLDDGKLLHQLRGHEDAISATAFAGDGLRLATGAADGSVRVWQLDAAHPDEASTVLRGHTQTVTALAFVEDAVLASASNDGTVRLWQLTSGEQLVLGSHDAPVQRLLRREGGPLVSVSYDGSARVWPTTGDELARRICEVVHHGAEPARLAALFQGRPPAPGCVPQKP